MGNNFTLLGSFRWLFLLFIILCSFITYAQITITQDDMPVPGTMIMRNMDTASIANPGNPGVNQTWDFGEAIPYLSDTVAYELPSEVSGGEMFPGANLAEGRTIYDINGNFYNYIFWNSTSDGLIAVGWILYFGDTGFTFLSTQQFDPNPTTIPLPFNYGQEFASITTGDRYQSTWIENIQIDSSRVISHITLQITVDGSGTLITPIDSYDVLRVMEVSTHLDSTFIWSELTGWIFDRTETNEYTNYRWFTNDIGEVATLSTDIIGNEFQYFNSYIVGADYIPVQNGVIVYPNPAGNLLIFESEDLIRRIDIYNLKGQLILVNGSETVIDISQIDTGIYVCVVNSAKGLSTHKFIKK